MMEWFLLPMVVQARVRGPGRAHLVCADRQLLLLLLLTHAAAM
jgi:hypothetical protein